MKPAPFEYVAPDSIEAVLALLAEHGDDAKILAGGQTLGPMLNMRVVAPAVLIDINRIDALDYQTIGPEGTVIGALTRQVTLAEHPALASRQPLVGAALPWIAHGPIRNRGTVGGSLAHADPAAEWGALVCALDAELVIARAGANRRAVAADDFFRSILETAIEPEELLTEIRLPPWPAGTRFGFQEFARRRGDFAIAGVGCRLYLDEGGRCRQVRISLIGVGDTALRARGAERIVEGETPSPELFRAAAAQAAEEAEPMSDIHGSETYRRHLVGILVEDALGEACAGCAGIA